MIHNKCKPETSIVMSVFNSSQFLADSIVSMLNQKYSEFEFLIINDCSTDDSIKIIEAYAKEDSRIQVINNQENLGLAQSLNKAIRVANGKFIARMDADDISHPERLSVQVEYLKQHPSIQVVGTDFSIINEFGYLIGHKKLPKSSKHIQWKLLMDGWTICHPSVVFRKKSFIELGGYPDLVAGQDRALWVKYYKELDFPIRNISQELFQYRVHKESTTKHKREIQKRLSLNVQYQLYEDELGVSLGEQYIWDNIFNHHYQFRKIVSSWKFFINLFIVFFRNHHPNLFEFYVILVDLIYRLAKVFIFSVRDAVIQKPEEEL